MRILSRYKKSIVAQIANIIIDIRKRRKTLPPEPSEARTSEAQTHLALGINTLKRKAHKRKSLSYNTIYLIYKHILKLYAIASLRPSDARHGVAKECYISYSQ